MASVKGNSQNSITKRNIFLSNGIASFLALAAGITFWWQGASTAIFIVLIVLSGFFLINMLYFQKSEKDSTSTQDLEEKLQEKETLLKEVHHRVKNNLQTVSSLLSLQSRTVADEKIENIIKGSQHRVVSMSMVHEMLYKRDDYSSDIAVQPYVEELCGYLIRSVKGNTNNIKADLNLGEYSLSIDTVIPLGLIINETVTNALKYGIPGESEGIIKIQLEKKGPNTYEMYLGDDGIGFPEEVSPQNTKSLGLKLIHNLARQLRGSVMRAATDRGTYYQITFEEVVEEFNSVD
ncbi:MAG: histidine kinase dimerization/phosphoacceptor domain -containing protein [Bacteroidota bacterium]